MEEELLQLADNDLQPVGLQPVEMEMNAPPSPINFLDDEIPLDELVGLGEEGFPNLPENEDHMELQDNVQVGLALTSFQADQA